MSHATPWRPSGVSLYVHVPFCASKCAYCDFESTPGALSRGAARSFVEGALDEVAVFADILTEIPTIYIGGGTPTLLGAELPHLVSALRALPGASHVGEVTVEANPDSLDAPLLAGLVESGVTRVSLGVQSFDDGVLRALGRRHDADAAARAISLLAASGLAFSIDLICGIPGCADDVWLRTLDAAVSCGAGHVSVYPLTVEEGTPLSSRIAGGEWGEPDPDRAADQMMLAERRLSEAGLARYEVASWARPGRESRHNRRYWTGGAYVGVGTSAASMLPVSLARRSPLANRIPDDCSQDARVRFVLSDGTDGREILSREEALREDAMLGLRLSVGISDELAEAAQAVRSLTDLSAIGLVTHGGGGWRTTQTGWLLGNEVFSRVWSAD